MPSSSLSAWQSVRRTALDEIAHAHAKVGGTKRGRRYATQHINQAYTMMVSSQFQGFCRDLHGECIASLVGGIQPPPLRAILQSNLFSGRKLDLGNPNPGNIGADFNRFGLRFWDQVIAYDAKNRARQASLEELNVWRNAIAHQDFDPQKLNGRTTVRLTMVREWRKACDELAVCFDELLRAHLLSLLGASPW